MSESFTERFAAGLASYGDQPCIEFEGRWYTGADLTAYAAAIASALKGAGVPDDAPVGLVVRNRPQHAATIIGFLAAGRALSMIYSFQSPDAIGRDIEKLNLSAVVADRDDWTAPVVQAAQRMGSAGLAIALTEPTVAVVEGLERCDHGPQARHNGTRCRTADSDQWHHWSAEAPGDQDPRAGAHRVQRDERREGGARRAARARLLAVRRHRRLPVGRGRAQRADASSCSNGSVSTGS